jgi:acyl-coenzyme A synthetase/AMP-(fatty) acid ligase
MQFGRAHPAPAAPSLTALAAASRGTATDAHSEIPTSSLAACQAARVLAETLRGKSVILATERQLETIAALIHLDGVARRIVLWPGDRPRAQIGSVLEACGADSVVTAWPLHEARSAGAAAPPPPAPAIASEWVLFTSGTTNAPKMVVHTLHSLSGHLWHAPSASAAQQDSVVWATFYDTRRYGGLQVALRALFSGSSLVLSDSAGETLEAFLARCGRAGVTHILGTPSHWRCALMTDRGGLISPNYVRLSGEVADQGILGRLRATYAEAKIVHAFASTEAGLAFEVADGLAGFPAAFVGDTGLAVTAVKDGALLVKSPRNAAGYLNGRITRIAGADGFVDTGDRVELRDGRYHFAGREDGVINVGGQKVHPEEVEAVINQHPAVRMSVVIGRRNPITGAVVTAQIVPDTAQGGAAPPGLERDIRAFCGARLAPYKVPATIRIVAALDVSPGGKLIRARA